MLLGSLCDTGRGNIYILAVYRRPSSSKMMFVKKLQNTIRILNKRCLIAGDINIDLLNKSESAAYRDMVATEGFRCLSEIPTRENKIIDHIFTRRFNIFPNRVEVATHAMGITDHLGLLLKLKIDRYIDDTLSISTQRFFLNKSKYKKLLNETTWAEPKENDAINTVFNSIY